MSTKVWRAFVCVLVVLTSILMVSEFSYAIKPLLIDGQQGSLGMTLVDPIGATAQGQGTYRLRVSSAEPGLPMATAGAHPGDFIEFDDYENRWRKFMPGERVDLTLYQGGQARRLSLVAVPVAITVGDYFDYGGRFLLALPALLFAVMIAFRQDGRSYRALSTTFITLSLIYFYNFNYSPAGATLRLSKFANIASYAIIWYGCVVFALLFQPYPASTARIWLRRVFPWYRGLAYLTTAYSIGFALGRETPWLWLGTLLVVILGLVMMFVSLVDGWRHTTGEVRQRHLWLLWAFAVGVVPGFLNMVPALDAKVQDDLRVTVMIYFVGQLLMFGGLAYAVLRYRVFDFDFAASRALVFAVASLLLLCVFGMIEWIYSTVLPGDGGVRRAVEKSSLVVDAIVVAIVSFAMRKVHRRLEVWVQRFLFGSWQVARDGSTLRPAHSEDDNSLAAGGWAPPLSADCDAGSLSAAPVKS
ncbi:hypothetical protein Q4S45_16670 [Massilia sp. R2A-15]|uniref:hypothetical protein n=1 Tax=Massilia sp. R2A-15 TaxID=3064278 RepID=UPI0027357E46|nr:hypothetical protein [Massilia sp. R2A-15]WLI88352.1 hypothetical protein Q4S45_16670 [Massilia sp. R2A-15]